MRQLHILNATIVRGCFTHYCYYTLRISDVRGCGGAILSCDVIEKLCAFSPFYFLHNASCY